MPTPDADPVRARLVGSAAALRAQGAVHSEAVERAFASVRRDRCATGFHTPDGVVEVPQDTVPPPEVLGRVYSDQALITHFDERGARGHRGHRRARRRRGTRGVAPPRPGRPGHGGARRRLRRLVGRCAL
jgi:hypothetical protein